MEFTNILSNNCTYTYLVAAAISLIKFLFLHTYRSTDFEVHRNWLAITHSLPLNKWYVDETSQWTLDYPPLFAWFEWILSQFAVFFDENMLKVKNLNYESDMTVLFQRSTVIFTDLIFAYGVQECIKEVLKRTGRKKDLEIALFLVIFGNAGLLLVDHIHFQYNGFLFGIMFISIARILQGRELESAFWFCILLNLKHIYLYVAPAYFVYLLRSYCLSSSTTGQIKWRSYTLARFFKLGVIVISVFALSFGPFIALGQLKQVLSRLFPFKRGLSHAYWAPNFWAIYNFVDKILALLGSRFGLLFSLPKGSMTGGLVQESDHLVLLSIKPFMTFLLTVVSMMPCLYNLWNRPHDPWHFLKTVIMCGFCSFLFGWHVHEKAILLVILPFGLICLFSRIEAKLFIILSIVGHFSLFPLIFTSHETILKVVLLLLHASLSFSLLKKYFNIMRADSTLLFGSILGTLESLYMMGLVPLFFYDQIIHRWMGLEGSLPFLPLMLISVYCCIGIFVSWIVFYKHLLYKFKSNVKLKST